MPVEFVKGVVGYREVKQNKEIATHMLYTLEEHEEKNETIRELKKHIEQLNKDCDYTIRKANKDAYDQIEIAENNAKIEISIIQKKLDEANDKIKHLDNINSNLIRVAKERANAKRGLTPKKQHSGYVILSIDEASYVHKDNTVKYPTTDNYPYWRVKLQTPYVATMNYSSVNDLIENDLKSKIGYAMGIKKLIGFSSVIKYSRKQINELWQSQDNFTFKNVLKINAVKGFWEVEYWVRYMIKIIPEMLVKTD